MQAVKNSFRKTFMEQRKLLLPYEEVPFARVVVMGMVIHFLKTGEHLFSSQWVCCGDMISICSHTVIGAFGGDGLDVGAEDDWDDYPNSGIGLSVSRKL
jgi:hypothetical protein